MASRKFTFQLDQLLTARRNVEQARQRDVATVERERVRIEEEIRRHQMSIAQCQGALKDGLVGALNVHGLRMQATVTISLMRKAHRAVLELAGVHRRLDAARSALIEAAKQRRAVEVLRDRRFEQWKYEIDRSETAALDELAVIAAARSRVPGRAAGAFAHAPIAPPGMPDVECSA